MTERLLIVEDEPVLCDSLKRVFEREGYEVSAAGTAETALQLCEAVPHDFDPLRHHPSRDGWH